MALSKIIKLAVGGVVVAGAVLSSSLISSQAEKKAGGATQQSSIVEDTSEIKEKDFYGQIAAFGDAVRNCIRLYV